MNQLRLISIFTLIILWCGTLKLTAQPRVTRASTPEWVREIDLKDNRPDDRRISEGYFLKLLDFQSHAEKNETYTRVVREVVNGSGVQYGAEVSVRFSPDYQELRFHTLWIHREGRRIDALDINKFRLVALEAEAAAFIYDGSYYAHLLLEDVRVGDRIEYSFSIKGRNPVFEDRFFQDVYLQSTVPIAQLYTSILVSSRREIQVKTFNLAPEPIIQREGALTRYIWQKDVIDPIVHEASSPGWYNPYQHVQLTEYKNWREVADWAKRINSIPAQLGQELRNHTQLILQNADGDLHRFAHEAIRFVQDEIRYTAVAIGEHSHRAHRPDQVFAQRYGDCKDKSLLLVSMLRHAGLEAQMALVSSSLHNSIVDQLPSPLVFDHAIVRFSVGGKWYWVDPTISYQGGDLDSRSLPEYGRALVLNEGDADLRALGAHLQGIVKSEERFMLSSVDTDAEFEVETVYTGHEADQFRAQMAFSGVWEIEKVYLDYYSTLYPEIVSTDSLHYFDDRDVNQITLRESYRIPGFLTRKASGAFEAELFAHLVQQRLPHIPATKTTPIFTNYPSTLEYRISVVSPMGWAIAPSSFFLDRDNYMFGTVTTVRSDTLEMEYHFNYHTSFIPASKVSEVVSDVKNMNDQYLSTYISINMPSLGNGTNIAWLALFWVIILLALAAFIAYRIYDKPYMPREDAQDPTYHFDKIEGWLIVPFLTFCFVPMYLLFVMFTSGYLNSYVWETFTGTDTDGVFRVLMALELTTTTILLALSVICLIFMIKRKVILPKLAITYYLLNLGFSLLMFILIQLIPSAQVFKEIMSIYQLFWVFVFSTIWVLYFRYSSRVRNTFVK